MSPASTSPSPPILPKKIAALLSVILWTLAFLLAFIIKPESPYIWLPDLLLLAGFLPLLMCWRPLWPWLVFALLNFLVGFVLWVAQYFIVPDLPAHIEQVRLHLGQYHSPKVWMLVGVAAFIYALLRMLKAFCGWSWQEFRRLRQK